MGQVSSELPSNIWPWVKWVLMKNIAWFHTNASVSLREGTIKHTGACAGLWQGGGVKGHPYKTTNAPLTNLLKLWIMNPRLHYIYYIYYLYTLLVIYISFYLYIWRKTCQPPVYAPVKVYNMILFAAIKEAYVQLQIQSWNCWKETKISH